MKPVRFILISFLLLRFYVFETSIVPESKTYDISTMIVGPDGYYYHNIKDFNISNPKSTFVYCLYCKSWYESTRSYYNIHKKQNKHHWKGKK